MTLHASSSWLKLVDRITLEGAYVAPRNLRCLEIVGAQSQIDMRYPVMTVKGRGLGYRFMPAEAFWILTGDARLATIAPYSKQIERFSDDGIYFQGAYGPMVVQQLNYVVNSLLNDKDTRQAVMTIWRPNPLPSKDIPCTISVQWFIRDGYIHCIDTMRSSDVWLGWPYDIFNFTMLTAFIALRIFELSKTRLKLGTLTLQAGSQHLYESNLDHAMKVLENPDYVAYHPFDLENFTCAQQLVDHLDALRSRSLPNTKRTGMLWEIKDLQG